MLVSTHSRPKAAAFCQYVTNVYALAVSTHSRPKAAAIEIAHQDIEIEVSTHSRPKAAAFAAFSA